MVAMSGFACCGTAKKFKLNLACVNNHCHCWSFVEDFTSRGEAGVNLPLLHPVQAPNDLAEAGILWTQDKARIGNSNALGAIDDNANTNQDGLNMALFPLTTIILF
jgi:hypothetical protein